MLTHKRHFAPGQLQFLTSSTYRRAKLFESDRFRLLAAELRSAPACELIPQTVHLRRYYERIASAGQNI